MPVPDLSPLTDHASAPRGVNPDAHAIQRLAEANGWEYLTHATQQALPGAVFRETNGTARFMQRAVNIVRISGPTPIEVGTSAYTEIAVGNQFTQYWAYVAVHLGVLLPAVVAEPDRLRARSAIPSVPAGAEPATRGPAGRTVQVHRLARDAAWVDEVFTPEVCAELDDGRVAFDVELTPGWVFLYVPDPAATTDPAVWARMFRVIDALLARIAAAPAPSARADTPLIRPAMRARGVPVNGRRVFVYLGVFAGAIAAVSVAFALFAGR